MTVRRSPHPPVAQSVRFGTKIPRARYQRVSLTIDHRPDSGAFTSIFGSRGSHDGATKFICILTGLDA